MKFGRPDYDSRLQPPEPLPGFKPCIPVGEPVFLIRAGDRMGLALIEAYANQLENGRDNDHQRLADPALVASVRAQLQRMREYRPTAKKYPDLP